MEIRMLEKDQLKLSFLVKGADVSYLNSLRRIMMNKVPTMAIEDVEIRKNSSVLYDETVAHRLGLIPIRTESGCYVQREKCTCGGSGCDRCSVTYTLSVEGPGMVYSRDLIPQDPRAVPALDNIPITKLTKDQKVVLEARAVMSTGKVHSKWQPTTACGYKNYPEIEVSDRCDACGQCVDECPRGILTTAGGRVTVIEGRLEECSLCRLCERACLGTGIGEESAIRVRSDGSRFIFVVEGDGSLTVREVIEKALEYLKSESDELCEKIGELSGVTGDEEDKDE